MAFLKAIPGTFIIIDPLGKIISINDVGVKRFNKPFSEIIGKNVFDQFPLFLPKKHYHQVIKNKTSVYFINSYCETYFYNTIYPILLDGYIKEIAIFAQDITEKKRIDDKKIKSQKADSLTLFGKGITHDFKNVFFYYKWRAIAVEDIFKR